MKTLGTLKIKFYSLHLVVILLEEKKKYFEAVSDIYRVLVCFNHSTRNVRVSTPDNGVKLDVRKIRVSRLFYT